MVSTSYKELYQRLKERGYNPYHLEVLAFVVKNSIAYKFRRKRAHAWQYEVVLPGYGHPPNKSKWIEFQEFR